MKTGPDALRTAENVFGSTKQENRTRCHRYRQKNSGAQNIKSGPDALRTVEKVSGSARHENGTRRPRYSRK
jgi:hypothetical protein